MDSIWSLIGSVATNVVAGVITYYVCKALDGDKRCKKDEKEGNENEG